MDLNSLCLIFKVRPLFKQSHCLQRNSEYRMIGAIRYSKFRCSRSCSGETSISVKKTSLKKLACIERNISQFGFTLERRELNILRLQSLGEFRQNFQNLLFYQICHFLCESRSDLCHFLWSQKVKSIRRKRGWGRFSLNLSNFNYGRAVINK